MSSSAADSVTEPPSHKRMDSVCQKRQNKPLIEKKRRARINECLQQLKAILMKDLKKESPRPSKLEKADILEMTVDYIKKMTDRKPESTDKECLTDKTAAAAAAAAASRGMPFLNGFSRCLEEVDTFLHTQLPLQPEVRNKLLSHCKEQLSAKDLAMDLTPPRSASLRSVSPSEDLPGRHLSDCASDLTSEDEDKLQPSSDGSGVVVTQTASELPAATATAFVAPFMHTSSLVSCPQPNGQHTTSGQNNGIKLAGPLKLICGGNVFIVVDQQQQQPVSNCVAVAAPGPPQSTPPSLSGQVICNPHTYSSAGVAAYIPAVGVPQMNTFAPAGVGLPVTSFPVTGHVTGFALNGSPTELATGTCALHGSPQSELSPPFVPSAEDSPSVENDINNNVVNMHAVWRPW